MTAPPPLHDPADPASVTVLERLAAAVNTRPSQAMARDVAFIVLRLTAADLPDPRRVVIYRGRFWCYPTGEGRPPGAEADCAARFIEREAGDAAADAARVARAGQAALEALARGDTEALIRETDRYAALSTRENFKRFTAADLRLGRKNREATRKGGAERAAPYRAREGEIVDAFEAELQRDPNKSRAARIVARQFGLTPENVRRLYYRRAARKL